MNSRSFNLHRDYSKSVTLSIVGALSIHPKILETSVGTSNGTDHFSLLRLEYSRPALKVVHSDRLGHFGLSVPHFCILLTRTSSFQWLVSAVSKA